MYIIHTLKVMTLRTHKIYPSPTVAIALWKETEPFKNPIPETSPHLQTVIFQGRHHTNSEMKSLISHLIVASIGSGHWRFRVGPNGTPRKWEVNTFQWLEQRLHTSTRCRPDLTRGHFHGHAENSIIHTGVRDCLGPRVRFTGHMEFHISQAKPQTQAGGLSWPGQFFRLSEENSGPKYKFHRRKWHFSPTIT